MKKIYQICTILVLLLQISFSQDTVYEQENSVIELTNDNYLSAFQEYEFLFITFYSNGCSHCQNFLPLFSKLAPEYQQNSKNPIQFAKVNVKTQEKFAEEFNIKSYPTILMVHQGNVEIYQNERSEKVIREYLTGIIKEINIKLKSFSEFNQIYQENVESNVSLYFGIKPEENQYYAYNIFSNAIRDTVQTYHTFDLQIAEQFGFKKEDLPNLILYRQGEQVKYDEKDFTLPELDRFFNNKIYPITQMYSDYLRVKIFQEGMPTILLITNTNDKESNESQIFNQVAKLHQGALPEFVQVVVPEIKDSVRLIGKLGFVDSELPLFMGVIYEKDGTLVKYKYSKNSTDSGEFTAEGLQKWVEEYKLGKAPQSWKGQEEVKFDDSKKVQQIVRSNFNQHVLESKQHVLVTFTAEWCQACGNLIPKLEQLSQSIGDDSLKIYTIDNDRNDIKGIVADSFPASFLYVKPEQNQQNIEPIQFTGVQVDINEIYHFLEQKLSSEVVPKLFQYSAKDEIEQMKINQKNNNDDVEKIEL